MTTLYRAADLAWSYALTCKDGAGNLVTPSSTPTAQHFTDSARTAGAVTLTVTATAQPQVFTISGVATPVGTRYLKHLIPTASGTATDADDDVQFTAVSGSVDSAIITVADAKLQLNITGTTHDVELGTYTEAVTSAVEILCGPVVSRVVTEWRDSAYDRIYLHMAPVLGVTSVTEYSGTTGTALTEEPLGGAVTASGYRLDLAEGMILRTASGAPTAFADGTRNVKVVYTAGRNPVPAAINLGARIILQHLWETQRGVLGASSIVDGEVITLPGFAYAIPRRAVEILAGYPAKAGFA